MSLPDTRERIEKSWNIRRALITKVLERGDTLVESLLLIPETGNPSLSNAGRLSWSTNSRKQPIYSEMASPSCLESEIVALAAITNPRRGW